MLRAVADTSSVACVSFCSWMGAGGSVGLETSLSWRIVSVADRLASGFAKFRSTIVTGISSMDFRSGNR